MLSDLLAQIPIQMNPMMIEVLLGMDI